MTKNEGKGYLFFSSQRVKKILIKTKDYTILYY